MRVKEFFEQFAPTLQLHDLNSATKTSHLKIEINDGGGFGGGNFTAVGDVRLNGGSVSIFSLTKPFENVYFGTSNGTNKVKSVSALDLEVKNWRLYETEKDFDTILVLKIEFDNRIDKY